MHGRHRVVADGEVPEAVGVGTGGCVAEVCLPLRCARIEAALMAVPEQRQRRPAIRARDQRAAAVWKGSAQAGCGVRGAGGARTRGGRAVVRWR